jgi:nucleolar protein 53
LERTLRKRLHASVDTAKTLRKAADRTQAARIKADVERRAKQDARLAQNGLVGQKIGKHVVREGGVDVQLGEELSESLRGLQVCAIQHVGLHMKGDAYCFVTVAVARR